MSFPTVVNRGIGASASPSTSHLLNVRSTGPDIQAGELLLVPWSGAASSVPLTPPGCTELYKVTQDGHTAAAWWKEADGTEGQTITLTTPEGIRSAHSAYRFAPGTWTEPPEAAVSQGNGANPNPPSLSPSWGSAFTHWLSVCHGPGPGPTNYPAGYTNAIGTHTGGEGSEHASHVSVERQLEAETEDPGAFTRVSAPFVVATIAVAGLVGEGEPDPDPEPEPEPDPGSGPGGPPAAGGGPGGGDLELPLGDVLPECPGDEEPFEPPPIEDPQYMVVPNSRLGIADTSTATRIHVIDVTDPGAIPSPPNNPASIPPDDWTAGEDPKPHPGIAAMSLDGRYAFVATSGRKRTDDTPVGTHKGWWWILDLQDPENPVFLSERHIQDDVTASGLDFSFDTTAEIYGMHYDAPRERLYIIVRALGAIAPLPNTGFGDVTGAVLGGLLIFDVSNRSNPALLYAGCQDLVDALQPRSAMVHFDVTLDTSGRFMWLAGMNEWTGSSGVFAAQRAHLCACYKVAEDGTSVEFKSLIIPTTGFATNDSETGIAAIWDEVNERIFLLQMRQGGSSSFAQLAEIAWSRDAEGAAPGISATLQLADGTRRKIHGGLVSRDGDYLFLLESSGGISTESGHLWVLDVSELGNPQIVHQSASSIGGMTDNKHFRMGTRPMSLVGTGPTLFCGPVWNRFDISDPENPVGMGSNGGQEGDTFGAPWGGHQTQYTGDLLEPEEDDITTPAELSGGFEFEDETHRYHVLLSSGPLSVVAPGRADLLFIPGGGGAGGARGGGGGAGGVRIYEDVLLRVDQEATIGAGGPGSPAGSVAGAAAGSPGAPTRLEPLGTAVPGGGAGAGDNEDGGAGTSGGGAQPGTTGQDRVGGAAEQPFGFPGGDGFAQSTTDRRRGAGGGGSGQRGFDSSNAVASSTLRPINPPWFSQTGGLPTTPWEIDGGTDRLFVSSTSTVSLSNRAISAGAMFLQAILRYSNVAGATARLRARWDGANTSHNGIELAAGQNSGNHTLFLRSIVAGTVTTLDSANGQTANVTDLPAQLYVADGVQQGWCNGHNKTGASTAHDGQNARFSGFSHSREVGTGTPRTDYDDFLWFRSKNIVVTGLPAGWKARVVNSGLSVVATATESSGTATIDTSRFAGVAEQVPFGAEADGSLCGWPTLEITDGSDVVQRTYSGLVRPGDEYAHGATVTKTTDGFVSGDNFSEPQPLPGGGRGGRGALLPAAWADALRAAGVTLPTDRIAAGGGGAINSDAAAAGVVGEGGEGGGGDGSNGSAPGGDAEANTGSGGGGGGGGFSGGGTTTPVKGGDGAAGLLAVRSLLEGAVPPPDEEEEEPAVSSSEPGTHLFFGAGDGSLYLAGRGHRDAGEGIPCRARSREFAPFGVGGDGVFKNVYFTLVASSTGVILLTPIVDGERKTHARRMIQFDSDGTFELQRSYELALYEPLIVGGTEIGRRSLRGSWFQLEVEVLDLWGCGNVYFEGFELEALPATESVKDRSFELEEWIPLEHTAAAHLFMGGGQPELIKYGDVLEDLGEPIPARATTRRYAPAGSGGECLFYAVYLTCVKLLAEEVTATARIRIDGQEVEERDLVLPVVDAPTRIVRKVILRRDALIAAEIAGRQGRRGTWVEVEVDVPGGTGDGILWLPGIELEYEVVTESNVELAHG